MTLDKIIEGVPLSVKKPIEGVILDEKNLHLINKGKYIILNRRDNPELILYFNKIEGVVTYKPLHLSHFLIVAREFGVPVYYIKEIVLEGEYVKVVPVEDKTSIRKRSIRIFGKLNSYRVYLSIKRTIEMFSIIGRIEYNIRHKKGILYLDIFITNTEEVEKDIISNPTKYITFLRLWRDEKNIGNIGVVAQYIGEIVYRHLSKKVEVRGLDYIPYWFEMSEKYSLLRFGRDYSNILKNVKIKRERADIPEDLKDLFELYKECVITYELKDRYLYAKKKD